jgi:hypothetical protein
MAEVDGPRAVVRLVVGDREYELADVDDPDRCNLGLAEDLLRLKLEAKRLGLTVRISEVRAELRELFDLMGLLTQLDDGPRSAP